MYSCMALAPVILRTADPADLTAVFSLAVAFYTEDGFGTSEQTLRANLSVLLSSSAAHVVVAQSETQLVGFAVTTTSFGLENGLIAELEDLFVMPTARRQGLGARLIGDSIEWARQQGCQRLELVLAPNGRDVGHLLDYYVTRGFHDDGRRLIGRPL